MKLAADLHIHSCLSPCADEEMTPNNIINMAYLKGLDVISVCDHNSALNLPAIKSLADLMEILLLPGIELQTREEVHLLCYLPTVESALALGDILYETLQPISNRPEFFGKQIVMDEKDNPIRTEDRLLIQSSSLTIEEAVALCRKFEGVPVPAHIDRQSNSILSNLGFIPPALCFRTLEKRYPEHAAGIEECGYLLITSSDAHKLCEIFERNHFIFAKSKSINGLLDYLSSDKMNTEEEYV